MAAAINKAYGKLFPAEEASAVETPKEVEAPAASGVPTAYAAAQGFGGPVEVTITTDADGKTLLTLVVGGDNWGETEGFGSKCKDAAFTDQFINKPLPLNAEEIDAVTGATVTSKAVIEAINKAYGKLFPAEEAPAASGVPTAYAAAQGFGGPVEVTITTDADGKTLLTLVVGGDNWGETEGFGSKCKDAAFTDQFINKPLPLNAEEIDAVTGATVTSKAVIEAINKAYGKLFPDAQH